MLGIKQIKNIFSKFVFTIPTLFHVYLSLSLGDNLFLFTLPSLVIVYSPGPNSRGGGTLAFWPKKLPKMAILRDKMKDFEKTKRGEAMK